MFRALGRFIAGFAVAVLVAGTVMAIFAGSLPAASLSESAELILLLATHFAIFSAAFVLIAAGIAGWQNISSWVFFTCAGMSIALLGFAAQYSGELGSGPSILNNYAAIAYVTAGALAGYAYWLIAARDEPPHYSTYVLLPPQDGEVTFDRERRERKDKARFARTAPAAPRHPGEPDARTITKTDTDTDFGDSGGSPGD